MTSSVGTQAPSFNRVGPITRYVNFNGSSTTQLDKYSVSLTKPSPVYHWVIEYFGTFAYHFLQDADCKWQNILLASNFERGIAAVYFFRNSSSLGNTNTDI
ncbi:hypothetical protein WN55_07292 [Dufourea novaeangliae]|uniref:Uncharacterized protein n=1 Tax=Dufourea novaeangliae TaxID=178035 RepID=A0A154P4D8_DUFNO|nr:hypothetical protein WN55_07292 [Dufourea novaeangliae]